MCLMMEKNKNILIFLSIGILLIVSIFFSFNKKEYHELPKVKVRDTVKNKRFALMLEQDNGEYKESTGELPTEGYTFNKEKSGCTDINGKIIDGALGYDYETYTILLDTSKTSYCYLYYDIEPNIKYLRDKDTDNHLTNELTGGMYRYQGIYEKDEDGNVTNDVKNYICLGDNCCATYECNADTSDNMYRIIGINAKGELKVIKKTSLTNLLAWNANRVSNTEWPDSDLFHQLNDNNEESIYNQLSNNLKKYIISKDWYYGDTILSGYDVNEFYKIEKGLSFTNYYVPFENDHQESQYKWNQTINAPLGMMYIHDFYYSCADCDIEGQAKNSWLFIINNQVNDEKTDDEWLLSRFGLWHNYYCARCIYSATAYVHDRSVNTLINVRPVFYLSNEIELTGEGTLENPFQIKNLNYSLN